MRRLLLVPLAVTLACATVPGPAATTSPPTATAARTPAGAVNDTLIPHIRWVRSSAEYRALALQAYRLATQEIERRVVGVPPGTWAVILDADETVLDNSEYQQSREGRGLLYTPETWTEWAQRGVAPAVPGSVAFTHRIRSMG